MQNPCSSLVFNIDIGTFVSKELGQLQVAHLNIAWCISVNP